MQILPQNPSDFANWLAAGTTTFAAIVAIGISVRQTLLEKRRQDRLRKWNAWKAAVTLRPILFGLDRDLRRIEVLQVARAQSFIVQPDGDMLPHLKQLEQCLLEPFDLGKDLNDQMREIRAAGMNVRRRIELSLKIGGVTGPMPTDEFYDPMLARLVTSYRTSIEKFRLACSQLFLDRPVDGMPQD